MEKYEINICDSFLYVVAPFYIRPQVVTLKRYPAFEAPRSSVMPSSSEIGRVTTTAVQRVGGSGGVAKICGAQDWHKSISRKLLAKYLISKMFSEKVFNRNVF